MIHLLRTAAGLASLQELQDVQAHFKTRINKVSGHVVVITTRNMPKRADELMDGGSIYWIIKNIIQARQKILDINAVEDADGTRYCQILLEPKIMRVIPQKHRAVQGWRYFDAGKAPRDLGVFVECNNAPDNEMAAALKDMGLI
jgi:hypothetical protein